MKYKICANKKALVDEAIPVIIFIFVAAIVIVAFRINENVKSESVVEDIQLQKDIVDGHVILMGYLNKIDEQGSNKAGFISKLIREKNYEPLKQDITEYFNKRLDLRWYIDVKDSFGNFIFPTLSNAQFSPQEQYASTKTANKVASALLPINSPDISYISIELYFLR